MKQLMLTAWCLYLFAQIGNAEETNPSMKQVKLFPYDYAGRTLTFQDVTLVDIGQGSLTLKKPFPRNIPHLAVAKPSESLSILFGNPEIIVTPELGKAVLPFIDRQSNIVVTVVPWWSSLQEWKWMWYVEKIEILHRTGSIETTLSALTNNPVREIILQQIELWEELKQLNVEAKEREEAEEKAAQADDHFDAKEPPREKMSPMMEQILGEVKIPLKPNPSTPSVEPVPPKIDQPIAKLSIPDVLPVESIKNRMEPPATRPIYQYSDKNHYLAMVEEKIDHYWVAPPVTGDVSAVVLKFRVARSGEISQIHIEESSGNGHYDSAAQRAVHAVNPLPPFPQDFKESYFDVRYRFIKKYGDTP